MFGIYVRAPTNSKTLAPFTAKARRAVKRGN
ncbi:MAG: hypothetical protein K0Q72_89 [Armatimonadetes bacterium]|jgi:hypothetical protein|nr:hypothetical protein [Armatimonadota bacterium]